MEAKIPGSSFDAGDTWLSWASVFSAIEARVYCYLKLLNLGVYECERLCKQPEIIDNMSCDYAFS